MKAEEYLKNPEKDKEATEWFNKKYHTPLVTIPELVGVHDNGEEEWREVPIGLILREYAQHVTDEERKINQTLRDQVKSFERIPDPEGKNKRIKELEKENPRLKDANQRKRQGRS